MFFIKKDQVDKDVERLRESMMTPHMIAREEQKKAIEKKHRDEALEGFGWKDVVAITIAIIEILLPYIIVFAVIMVILWQIIYRSGMSYYG